MAALHQPTEQQTPTQPKRAVHRQLRERLVVTGTLVLTSPAHFGNGDAEALTDLPLLLDEVSRRPLITGASLAGALRNYLREWQWGYELPLPSSDPQSPDYRDGVETEKDLWATALFGGHRGDELGAQSPLIVDDAVSAAATPLTVELRDGVALDARTRTAAAGKKYDYELLPVGTKFALRFELLLDEPGASSGDNDKRKEALALALNGLAKGEIHLGARKRRGFGACRVYRWTVTSYDLRRPRDLFAWLAADYQTWVLPSRPASPSDADITALLGLREGAAPADRREIFAIEGRFEIDGSLMVRSGFGDSDEGPDAVHLHRRADQQAGKNASKPPPRAAPVLPGTSVAGALRQRALRIAQTLAGQEEGAARLIDSMFGPAEITGGEAARASRVRVSENLLEGGHTLVQTRIKIDRFTGGTVEAALLEEAPHFGGAVTIQVTLRNPEAAEIGLLLLVWKDLWLGDLPLGGEISIGRGRLRGASAKLRCTGKPPFAVEWREDETTGALTLSDESARPQLETCVAALRQMCWAEGNDE